LSYIKLAPARALDLGCGLGQGLAVLRAQYPDAQICGLDWSAAMLARAQQLDPQRTDAGWLGRLLRKRPVFDFAQADFRALPFANASFDLLWSNLALHWDPSPHAIFPEWHRVAAEGGLLMFSLFGPDTLRELRSALAGIDAGVHTLRFVDMHDIGDMLVEGRWSTPVMDMEQITITYETPQALLADVHLLGGMAGLVDAEGRALAGLGLHTPRWRQDLFDALDAQRNPDGLIPLTFEIVYGHAWKLAQPAKQALDDQGRAVISVDQIGRKPRS
jgi:malonyl-CoA O-methyltransferase